jgi:hypothetical protein
VEQRVVRFLAQLTMMQEFALLYEVSRFETIHAVCAIPFHFLPRAGELPRSYGHESGELDEVYCNELADIQQLQRNIHRSERGLRPHS